jgi:ectoine hydroxylase-related dioxygenase (phytanoyl-CoA dioxygenase family)
VNAAAYPLIELVERFQLRSQTEVACSAMKVASQLTQTTFHRDSPAMTGEFFDATLEL